MSGTTYNFTVAEDPSYSTADVLSVSAVSAAGLPQNSEISLLDLGQAGINGLVTADGLTFGSGASGGSITFTGGASGVYDGNDPNVAADPELGGTPIGTNYFAAEPNGGITFDFNSAQTYFGILWGSVDPYNTLTFYNGSQIVGVITGQDLANNGLSTGGDSDDYYVGINVPGGYTSVVVTSSSPAMEFLGISYSTANITDPYNGTGSSTAVSVTDNGQTLCFFPGTLIATPEGDVAVEALKPGVTVCTADGDVATVAWLGRQSKRKPFMVVERDYPVRIKAGALAEGVPVRDLLISPDHALLLNDILVQAGALVNGVSIVREMNIPSSFIYYHVETDNHELILAEGVPVETFIDNVDRQAFDNWAERRDVTKMLVEMPLPRTKSARQLPVSIRTSLTARIETLFGAAVSAA